MSDERKSRIDYCVRQVRTYDRDRYLSALFAPEERRGALFALYAFNLEIAKVRETVSEPLLGQMRLQWWRDTIETIYAGDVRRHQVAEALADAVSRHGLSRAAFDRLIDAREFDLADAPPENIEALERYSEDCAATLNILGLEILGKANAETARAARHGGIACALTGLLRTTPFLLRQGRCPLPEDLLRREGLASSNIDAASTGKGLRQVVAEIAGRASEHLEEARRHRSRLPREALPILLPATLAAADLKMLQRTGFDVFSPRNAGKPLARQFRLTAAALFNRF